MDFTSILKAVVESGGPAMAVAVLFLYYLHKQTEKKDDEVAKVREENKALVTQLIGDMEKRLIADQENRSLLQSIIDRSGSASETMREAFTRLEQNQKTLMAELRSLKDLKLK